MENAPVAEVVETTPQEAPSIEDRFAAAMGLTDEPPVEQEVAEAEAAPEAEATEQEAAPAEEEAEIEINGEKYVVPKELKDAFLRQQDYTRKTQEVAEQRKAVEAAKEEVVRQQQIAQFQAQVQQVNLQHLTKLQQIDSTLKQFENVDWNNAIDSDPVQAMKLQQQYQSLQAQRNQVLQQYAQANQQAQQYFEQAKQEHLTKAAEEVKKAIPSWSAETQVQLREFGKSIGFSDAELGAVTDPRAVVLLHKAMQFDQLMKAQPAVNKKVANAPKAIKPGAQQQPKSDKEVLRKVIKTSRDRSSKHQAIAKYIERLV